jgi:hypothetical protein
MAAHEAKVITDEEFARAVKSADLAIGLLESEE